MPFFNTYELNLKMIDNRIFLFNKELNPYLELVIKEISRLGDNIIYGTTGYFKFSSYHFSIKDPISTKYTLEEIKKNPQIILLKILGIQNYILTGLRRKLVFNTKSQESREILNLVVKYYISNNKNYVAVYSSENLSEITVKCCFKCIKNNQTQTLFAFGEGEDAATACDDCKNTANYMCRDGDIDPPGIVCLDSITDQCQ